LPPVATTGLHTGSILRCQTRRQLLRLKGEARTRVESQDVRPGANLHSRPERERNLRTRDGYEWLYVLSGEMRLILGEHDITMGPGEVAEFDTRLPHWFGAADAEPVEILSVHSTHGKRMHVRAAPRRTSTGH
jgi:quercetin dioxygenase-like cupin family protein